MIEKKKMDRQTLGLLLALGFGIVIVGAVLFITLSAGGNGDPTAPTTTAPPPGQTAPPPVPTTQLADVDLPSGDYGPYCAELARQGAPAGGVSTVGGTKALFAKLDFDALVAAAPEGLKPDIEAVGAVRDEVLAQLATAEDVEDIDPTKFPPAFVKSMPVLVAAAIEKCSIEG